MTVGKLGSFPYRLRSLFRLQKDRNIHRDPGTRHMSKYSKYSTRHAQGAATEVGQYDERLEGKLDGLRREVWTLREQNQQLNFELHRTPAVSYRHSSMPADLASSSSLRSAMIGTLLPAPVCAEQARGLRNLKWLSR
jgi:hypothetical protein